MNGPSNDLHGSRPMTRSLPARPSRARQPRNRAIAERLREAADLIDSTKGNVFRAAAYRKAAASVTQLDRDLRDIARSAPEGGQPGGQDALEAIPGVGPSISRTIMQLIETGRWPYLEQLRGSADPVRLLRTIPGLGPVLAKRIADTLHVSTLEQLARAAEQGRLGEVRGLGPRRARMLSANVHEMLSQTRWPEQRPDIEPPVAVLLDIDRQYRAQADILPKIAPRRFNPDRAPWLPVLHARRGEWTLAALFSNSARAHELRKHHDWVVISFSRPGGPDGQRTVVTETHGTMIGRRVVRGREAECAPPAPSAPDLSAGSGEAHASPPPYGPPPLEIEPLTEAQLGPVSPGAVAAPRSAR